MTDKASLLVTQAKQWATNYGDYTLGEEGTALTVPLRFRGAWDSNDHEAIASIFAEDGVMVIGDLALTGPQEIGAYLADVFAGGYKGSTLVEKPVEVRIIAPGVALAVLEGGVLLPGETEVAPERSSRATYVAARRNDEWKLINQQTSPMKG
ncbi:SgcJ/EcaC family oxidoreductase [Actinosynnema sp. CA-248983]